MCMIRASIDEGFGPHSGQYVLGRTADPNAGLDVTRSFVLVIVISLVVVRRRLYAVWAAWSACESAG